MKSMGESGIGSTDVGEVSSAHKVGRAGQGLEEHSLSRTGSMERRIEDGEREGDGADEKRETEGAVDRLGGGEQAKEEEDREDCGRCDTEREEDGLDGGRRYDGGVRRGRHDQSSWSSGGKEQARAASSERWWSWTFGDEERARRSDRMTPRVEGR